MHSTLTLCNSRFLKVSKQEFIELELYVQNRLHSMKGEISTSLIKNYALKKENSQSRKFQRGKYFECKIYHLEKTNFLLQTKLDNKQNIIG